MQDLLDFLKSSYHPAPSRILSALKDLFVQLLGSDFDAPRFAVYVRKLADIEISALERACEHAQLESRFLPSVAELRERARAYQPAPAQPPESRRTPPALAKIVTAALESNSWNQVTGSCEGACGGSFALGAALVALLREQGAAVLCGRCINARLHGEVLH